jgi:polyhydroxyalkanoate synthase subunit PhaC
LSDPAGAVLAELSARVSDTLARLARIPPLEVGCSPKRAVLTLGTTTLYEYLPLPGVKPRMTAPLLVCFALVNRPYVLDLQPDRSLVRRLLEAGLPVYLIDWGTPGEGDRHLELNDYVERYLGGCVAHLLERHGGDSLDLLGVCQGGVLSLCYSALHPQRIRRLVTLTTPVDFHTEDNLLSRWVRGLDTQLLAECGNVPGEVLNALFLSLSPLRLTQEKYVRLLTGRPQQGELEDFVRMERWIFDSPPQAAAALAQFVRWFYQENAFVTRRLRLGGRAVDLRRIRAPLLNLYARHDHIVPATACAPLGRYVGSRNYSGHEIATGHIGMYVSRAARTEIPARIVTWLTHD